MKERAWSERVLITLLGAAAALVCLASSALAAPPKKPPLRVAIAQVAERRTLAFPDSLPLHVEYPWWTLTAQPRNLPEQVFNRFKKVVSSMDGLVFVHAPELRAYPKPHEVRASAGRRLVDAVLVVGVRVGYGQMRAGAFRRLNFLGEVQVDLDILSGRTGMPLTQTLVLKGDDDIQVNFRRKLDYDTLHYMGPGPEVRQRIEWSVREVGEQFKEKFSAAWLEAALAEEGLLAETRPKTGLGINRVALEPETPRLGDKASMIISYEVSGLAPDALIDVTETRILVRDGQLVAGPFRTIRTLGNGTHTSTQNLYVPATAEGGAYTILGSVEGGGTRADGSGSFTILEPQ